LARNTAPGSCSHAYHRSVGLWICRLPRTARQTAPSEHLHEVFLQPAPTPYRLAEYAASPRPVARRQVRTRGARPPAQPERWLSGRCMGQPAAKGKEEEEGGVLSEPCAPRQT